MKPTNWTLKRQLETAARARSPYAPTLLRVGLGAVFLAHSYAKLAVLTMPGTVAFFQAHGFPGWMAYPVLGAELVGGVSLLLGFQVRLAAAGLIPVLLGALVPHLGNGWMFSNPGGGWEYVAFLLVALCTLLLLGGGPLALSRPASYDAKEAE